MSAHTLTISVRKARTVVALNWATAGMSASVILEQTQWATLLHAIQTRTSFKHRGLHLSWQEDHQRWCWRADVLRVYLPQGALEHLARAERPEASIVWN